jgi:hypothetical protein
MTVALRGGQFTTFDVVDQRLERVRKMFDMLNESMTFIQADLENKLLIDANAEKAVKSADFLFNDGGNKDVEAWLYAKFLRKGAGYFQHDFSYSNAIPQSDWFLEKEGFVPIYEEIALLFNSCGRMWVKR